MIETRNCSTVFQSAKFSRDVRSSVDLFCYRNNSNGTKQIAINYSLLQKDVRGHQAVVSGWGLQIAEGACFPRDFKSKSRQIA
jgi:hypothetical protein